MKIILYRKNRNKSFIGQRYLESVPAELSWRLLYDLQDLGGWRRARHRLQLGREVREHRVDVHYDVLERGVCPEHGERLALVQQRVHEVGVVVEARRQTRVDDLEDHSDHFLQHRKVLHL